MNLNEIHRIQQLAGIIAEANRPTQGSYDGQPNDQDNYDDMDGGGYDNELDPSEDYPDEEEENSEVLDGVNLVKFKAVSRNLTNPRTLVTDLSADPDRYFGPKSGYELIMVGTLRHTNVRVHIKLMTSHSITFEFSDQSVTEGNYATAVYTGKDVNEIYPKLIYGVLERFKTDMKMVNILGRVVESFPGLKVNHDHSRY